MAEQRFEEHGLIITTKLIEEGLLITWENTNPHIFTKRELGELPDSSIGRIAGNIRGSRNLRTFVNSKKQTGEVVDRKLESGKQISYVFQAPTLITVRAASIKHDIGTNVVYDPQLEQLQKQVEKNVPQLFSDDFLDRVEVYLLTNEDPPFYIRDNERTANQLLKHDLYLCRTPEETIRILRASSGIRTDDGRHYDGEELSNILTDKLSRNIHDHPGRISRWWGNHMDDVPTESGFRDKIYDLMFAGYGAVRIRAEHRDDRMTGDVIPMALVETVETVEFVSLSFDVFIPKKPKKPKPKKIEKPSEEELMPEAEQARKMARLRSQLREAARKDMEAIDGRTDLSEEEKKKEKALIEGDYKLYEAKRDGLI